MTSHGTTVARRANSQSPPGAAAAGEPWSPLSRQVASVLLVLHLTAVFAAPFAAACTTSTGSSPFADGLVGWFRPYIDLMYLNHGYAFFAPNPESSHLVRYRVEFDDGRAPIEGVLPNLQNQRPRLLYHRHFMLAETLYNLYVPPEEPQYMGLDPEMSSALSDAQRKALETAGRQRHREQLKLWKHSRAQYDALRHSMERHLLAIHGGSRVVLTRMEHRLLLPEDFEVVRKLDSPHTYRDLPEGQPAREVIRP